MKYYKISEDDLKKLVGYLDNEDQGEDEYHNAKFDEKTEILNIEGFYGSCDLSVPFKEIPYLTDDEMVLTSVALTIFAIKAEKAGNKGNMKKVTIIKQKLGIIKDEN